MALPFSLGQSNDKDELESLWDKRFIMVNLNEYMRIRLNIS